MTIPRSVLMMCCGLILFNLLTIRILINPFPIQVNWNPSMAMPDSAGCIHGHPSVRLLSTFTSRCDICYDVLFVDILLQLNNGEVLRLTFTHSFLNLMCYFLCSLQDVERIQSILIKLGVEVIIYFPSVFYCVFSIASITPRVPWRLRFILFTSFISILQTCSHFSSPFSLYYQ